MNSDALKIINVETPGDVAVRDDGLVAIADMTLGKVTGIPLDATREQISFTGLPDVRSIFWNGHKLFAACTFSKQVELIEYSNQRKSLSDLVLPAWIESSPGGELYVAEIGARRLQKLSFEMNTLQKWVVPPLIKHLTCFSFDNYGTLWIPNRPSPEVIEVQMNSGILRRHQLQQGKNGEFTGICRDLSSKNAMLILDRREQCLWRLETGRFEIAAKIPRKYCRLRALRAHEAGKYPYSAIDPPTGSILWFDRSLSIREIWKCLVPLWRTVIETSTARRDKNIDIIDIFGKLGLRLPGKDTGIPLHAQPRDLRILGSSDILLVLRDNHCVIWTDSRLNLRAYFGGANCLLYPCSADYNPKRKTIVVVDPLRSRLVEFDRDGSIQNIVPTLSTYIRWVRCCDDGSAWIIDVANQKIMLFSPDWNLWKTIDVPFELDLTDINKAESSFGGSLLIGGPRVGEWIISTEEIYQLQNQSLEISQKFVRLK